MSVNDTIKNEPHTNPEVVNLFLAGDVMTGRGIDQILPHSVDPRLYERYVQDARQYVRLTERKHGTIPDEVSYSYIWGEALAVLQEQRPDARIINLETAVTTHGDPSEQKAIHYRMHPDNIEVLTVAGIDCGVLGNNHVLDWKADGLRQTLSTLHNTGITTAGAGTDKDEAMQPAQLKLNGSDLLVFAYGTVDAGVPPSWEAGKNKPGINVLRHPVEEADRVIRHIQSHRQSDECVLVSMHWGSNWGYHIPQSHRSFAHQLIDAGAADLIFGHSSHHPKGIEVYRNRLILYGCGDLINDYEGISGHERYRSEIRLMYFPHLYSSGKLAKLSMIPVFTNQLKLHRTSAEQTQWIMDILGREVGKFNLSVSLNDRDYILLNF